MVNLSDGQLKEISSGKSNFVTAMILMVNYCISHSRPLGKIALVSDPAIVIGTNCVVDVRTPGHVGKNIKEVFELFWRQGAITVLT